MPKELPSELNNPAELKNPLKSEHLKDKKDAIMACVGTQERFFMSKDRKLFLDLYDSPTNTNNRNVDFYGESQELRKQKFKNAGRDSFVISPIDGFDKLSKTFINCTGLVVAGRDKKPERIYRF